MGVVEKQPPTNDDDSAYTMNQLDGNVSVSSIDTSVCDDDQSNTPNYIPVHTGYRPVSNHSKSVDSHLLEKQSEETTRFYKL